MELLANGEGDGSRADKMCHAQLRVWIDVLVGLSVTATPPWAESSCDFSALTRGPAIRASAMLASRMLWADALTNASRRIDRELAGAR